MELQQSMINQLMEFVMQYMSSLDWSYIITFILLTYGANQPKSKAFFFKIFKVRLKTRYRTLIIGVLYGVALFFIRGKDPELIEQLFKALLFAMIFHKLLIDQTVQFLDKKLNKAQTSGYTSTDQSNEEK